MPIQQEFDPALPRRRRQRLIAVRTHSLSGWRNSRARISHRAVRERQPFDLEAKDFRFAGENFQSCLLCADDARSADQRFEEGEGAFGLRIDGSIKRFGHSRPIGLSSRPYAIKCAPPSPDRLRCDSVGAGLLSSGLVRQVNEAQTRVRVLYYSDAADVLRKALHEE
jgi:hypothetical protein